MVARDVALPASSSSRFNFVPSLFPSTTLVHLPRPTVRLELPNISILEISNGRPGGQQSAHWIIRLFDVYRALTTLWIEQGIAGRGREQPTPANEAVSQSERWPHPFNNE